MSKVRDVERKMSNYAEFKSAVKTYGFSTNNLYDVQFIIPSTSPRGNDLYQELLSNLDTKPTANAWSSTELMRLYTDQASMPGIQMSTGEYRINNSPQLKYTYGAVFSEMNISFMLDADSIISSVFDIWTNWMYSYSHGTTVWSGTRENRMRSNYRDDYAVDIVIVKYESVKSSKYNNSRNTTYNRDQDRSFNTWDIIPDKRNYTGANYTLLDGKGKLSYRKHVPVHATRLFKAFPANISSVPLSFGDTSMNKLSVGFEYESHTTTAINNGKISGGIRDIINGG